MPWFVCALDEAEFLSCLATASAPLPVPKTGIFLFSIVFFFIYGESKISNKVSPSTNT